MWHRFPDFWLEWTDQSIFDIELSKEEINEDKRIIFELTAKWMPLEK